MHFEWDSAKEKANRRKHGVSFDEAASAFRDPLAAIFDDEGHSTEEVREILVGRSLADRLLVVAFTERVRDTVRVISARLATTRERKNHEDNRRP